MDRIFLKVLNMSIAAGWLILAVIAVRLLLGKAPRRMICVLWAVVAVRLLCPFFLESAFSLIPSSETIRAEVVRYASEPFIDSGIPGLNEAVNPIIGERFAPEPGASVNPLYIWTAVAGMVWIAGAALMLVYALACSLRLHAAVREAVPLEIHAGTRGAASPKMCDTVTSPFILGIIRPRIYLPSGMQEEQIPYILAHEQAHIKRLDHCAKPLGWLLLSVYWFHPLVWAAYTLFCRDLELACDEKAAGSLDLNGRKAYAHALLACSLQRKTVFSYPLAFGEVGVRERVNSILQYRKPAGWLVAAVVLVCVAVVVFFLTDPKERADDSKIRYMDQWYSRDTLSAETIEWLEWYNSLSEEEQLAVSSIPHDLYDLAGYGGGPGMVETVDAEADLGVEAVRTEDESDDTARTKEAGEETTVDIRELSDDFGIALQLPDNENWIRDREYRQPAENTVEVYYWDMIAEADCRLTAVRDGELNLNEPDTVYDAALEETWMGSTVSGQIVYVKVQRSGDGKKVLATWEYNSGQHQYQFAIQAEVQMPVENADISPVPKTALTMIGYME